MNGVTGSKTDGRAALAARFPRLEQTFPALAPQEIARMRGFGELRNYKDGERLFETGKPGPGMFVILSGHIAISQRDGLGHVTPVIEQGPGQFLAEIGQLSGRPALVDGHAEGEVETLLIPPERLRALLVAEADLGERIMRALILRRGGPVPGGVRGPGLIRPAHPPRLTPLPRVAPPRANPNGLGRSARSARRPGTRPTRSPSWAAVRRVLRLRCTRPRKVSRWPCWTRAPSADRPAPAPGSKIISASPRESRARRWPGAPSPRRRSSAPTS